VLFFERVHHLCVTAHRHPGEDVRLASSELLLFFGQQRLAHRKTVERREEHQGRVVDQQGRHGRERTTTFGPNQAAAWNLKPAAGILLGVATSSKRWRRR